MFLAMPEAGTAHNIWQNLENIRKAGNRSDVNYRASYGYAQKNASIFSTGSNIYL